MSSLVDEQTDFSLVQGGPFYRLLLRAGLVKGQMELALRRIVVISALTWLPLLLFTLLSGHAVGGEGIPFLFD
jgi:hypothetical protein